MTHFGSHICSYTVLRIGAVLWLTVPTTIKRSDCRGVKRGSAAPKRSVSYNVELTDMNSMPQQAVTKGYGNKLNLRIQPTSSSFLVVMYSIIAIRTVSYTHLRAHETPEH